MCCRNVRCGLPGSAFPRLSHVPSIAQNPACVAKPFKLTLVGAVDKGLLVESFVDRLIGGLVETAYSQHDSVASVNNTDDITDHCLINDPRIASV